MKISKNTKEILYKFFLLIIGLSVAITISEWTAGIYIKNTKDKGIRYFVDKAKFVSYGPFFIKCPDNKLGWSLRPNVQNEAFTSDFHVVYSINSDGIRDKEIVLDKPAEEFRIVALGESNLFGEGVSYEKRFTEVIEKSLNNVNVINMGIPGYGLDQSFLQLQECGLKYSPNLVILFAVKDLIIRRPMHYQYFPGLLKPRFVFNEDGSDLILEDMDLVYNKYIYKNKSVKKNSSSKIDGKERNSFFVRSSLLMLLGYHRPGNIDMKNREQDAILKKDGYSREYLDKLIFKLMGKFKKLCSEHRVDIIVVNIDVRKIDSLGKLCAKLNIPYLDLSDILSKTSRLNRLTFEIDPHYNKFTHRIIGEYTSEYIKEKYNLVNNKEYTYQTLSKF